MSKTQSLINYLQTGLPLTQLQIQKLFKLKNPTATIHRLRTQGYCIYSDMALLKNGDFVCKYRLGEPSKEMVSFAAKNGFFYN